MSKVLRLSMWAALAGTGGCATSSVLFPAVDPPVVWPSGTARPRIAYVGQIRGKADLKRSPGIWEFLAHLTGGRGTQQVENLAGPVGVALSEKEILYVADPPLRAVHIFDLVGRTHRLARNSAPGRPFHTPLGLAVMGDRVLVTDRVLHTVSILTPDGKAERCFGETQLTGPVGITVGPVTGHIYVADTASHDVKVFGRAGKLLRTIGARGRKPGTFNYPTFIACDAEENLYVTDTLNFRIQVFDNKGQLLRTWGKKGDWPGALSQPKGISVDRQGRVFVVDAQFENVQIFSSRGRILLAFGEEGTGPGGFWLPTGLFVDHRNRIWVADTFNRRIQVFKQLPGELSGGKR